MRFGLLPCLLALAACVDDPIAPADLTSVEQTDLSAPDLSLATDLASSPDLLADLTASLDLTSNPDLLPPPPDLLALDLLPAPPTWVESNEGLDGAGLLYVGAGDSVYVSNLYDVYRFNGTINGFEHVWLDWSYSQGGIASLTAQSDRVYIGLSAGRVLRVVGNTVTDLTSLSFTGAKPVTSRAVSNVEANRAGSSDELYVSDGKDVYLFDPSAIPDAWQKISSASGFPSSQTIYRLRSSEDGLKLFVAASAGILVWNGSTWSTDTGAGAAPLHLDSTGIGLATHVAAMRYDGSPMYYDGASWSLLPAIGGPAPYYISEGNDGSLVTTTEDGLHLLTSTAASMWSLVRPAAGALASGVERSPDRSTLYVTGDHGLYAATTTMPGEGSYLTTGLHGVMVYQLVYSSIDANRLYAATDYGLFRSDDLGVTWTALSDDVLKAGEPVRMLAVAKAFPGEVLYPISNSTLFRSTDGGVTFTDLGQSAHAVATAAGQSEYVFVCSGTRATPGAALVSANRGQNFDPYFLAPSTCDALAVGTSIAILYVAAGKEWWSGPALTTMPGLTKQYDYTTSSLRLLTLVEQPGTTNFIALTDDVSFSQRKIVRLEEAAARVLNAGPVGAGGILSMTMSPADPTRLWVGAGNGVYVSDVVSTAVFTNVSNGLPGGSITAILQSPTNPSLLWAGVEERGVYRSP